jgi:transposase-like protein
MLERNGIKCSPEEAKSINLNQRRGQLPATHAKYKEAIAACDSMEYIECNVSEIAREFGLSGTNLGRQLRTHYPEVLEFRERARQRLGLDDGLPRGTRPWCKEQYAEAIELLRADRYVTVQEAAERCNVSYSGLEQHLIFYHKKLVDNRIKVRKQAVRRQRKGEITGRGTLHAPTAEITKKYAEALHLYRTTPMSARKIAKQTDVPIKGFYEYLQTWHKDLVCQRKGIPYEEGKPVDWSQVQRYNPATAAKYADAIAQLKAGGKTTAEVAAEFGLHPECFRQYLKEHEPELHASLGMVRTDKGSVMSQHSMGKYAEALHLYATTTESIKSLARRFGFNDCAFGQFIRRQFPEMHEQHQKLVQQMKKTD